MDRPSTLSCITTSAGQNVSPPTPEVTRQLEESRLRSKGLCSQREAELVDNQPRDISGLDARQSIQLAGTKRRRGDDINAGAGTATRSTQDATDELLPLKKTARFVDYNLSAMTDTKGGFLSAEEDPFNKQMSGGIYQAAGSLSRQEPRPAHMTAAEWKRLQLLRKLRREKAGPFEPGLSAVIDRAERKKCRECGSLEIDFVWAETFGCCVCNACKEKVPEKYSLLTKTECREDYLITDPELKDAELLPHLSKPNPHKSHWHDMMLFLRYQVEEYAFNTKWGSAEALDAEFARREADKKRRKEVKYKEKLLELKRKTRTDAYRRNLGGGANRAGGAKKFGDAIEGKNWKHVHDWGRAVENEEGLMVKTCTICGMEVEEMEF